MGVWDAISNGEIPTMDDVVESGTSAYETVESAGEAISSGAEYLVDGAVELGHEAYGAGERAVDTVTGLPGQAEDAWDDAWDRHFDRNEHNRGPTDLERRNLPAAGQEGQTSPDGWRLMGEGESMLHQDPSTQNPDGSDSPDLKYVHPDGSEYVVSQRGEEVTNGAYEGTYNYATPTAWNGWGELDEYVGSRAEHAAYDVVPYILEGSVRDDHPDNADEGGIWDRSGAPVLRTLGVTEHLNNAGEAISNEYDSAREGLGNAYDYLTDW